VRLTIICAVEWHFIHLQVVKVCKREIFNVAY